MKRTGLILCLSLLIAILSSSLCFAAGFELVSSYPEEGSDYSTLQNVAVKLTFSEPLSQEATQEKNQDCFRFTDAEGKEVAITVVYDGEKYPGEAWLIVEEDLQSNKDYTVTVSADLQSDSGNKLGQEEVITFRSRNTAADSSINMLLMVIMIAAIVVFGAIETKRQVRKEMERRGEVETVNPYKESKRTGKSVEEIVAKTEKEKERVAKKYAAYQAQFDENRSADDWLTRDVKRVKGPKSVKAAGGTIAPSILAKSRELARVARALEAEEVKQAAREKAQKNKNKRKK